MKPREVYDAPFLSETLDIYPIVYFLDGIDEYSTDTENQDRVVIRTHFDPYIDGIRNGTLYSVWYKPSEDERKNAQDDESLVPVFICKTAGRPDYEYYGKFVTDKHYFHALIGYLRNLQSEFIEDVVDIDDDIQGLNEVYGYSIGVKDLGKIPHMRNQIFLDLKRWATHDGWPYSGSLRSKKELRWARLQKGMEKLSETDPESKKLLKLSEASRGTSKIVAQMTHLMRNLV